VGRTSSAESRGGQKAAENSPLLSNEDIAFNNEDIAFNNEDIAFNNEDIALNRNHLPLSYASQFGPSSIALRRRIRR